MAHLVRFIAEFATCYGLVEGETVRELDGDIFGDPTPSGETFNLGDVTLLPPTMPGKILAVGRNYRSHLGDRPAPKVPELFFKPPSCLVAHDAEIVLPAEAGEVHFEGELVVVVGRKVRNVSTAEAARCILGYACGNDVSAREWQKNDLQWWRAKGSDTFGPCGPWITTGLDASHLMLRTRLNGKVVQEQTTADLLFPVPEIIAWASRHVTLEPGDLIFTGTPGTTSALAPGDRIEVEIEGVGLLSNPVAAEPGKDRE